MIAGLVTALAVLAAAASAAPPKGAPVDHRLLPGAQGDLCLDCHEEFKAKLDRPVLHTPVRKGECVGCHDPHAGRHDKLLSSGPKTICFSCHETLVPAAAKSVHAPAADGSCGKCHDAHAADRANLVLKAGAEGCSECHAELWKRVQQAKVRHEPIDRKGCTACHDPHASERAGSLLADAEPQLCLECHKATTPAFAKAHAGYPVAKGGCSSCHDPHGSNAPKLLRDHVHEPVAKRRCDKCHVPAGTGAVSSTRAVGAALCGSCHEEKMTAMLGKAQVHSALAGERACLTCHDPHASSSKGLLATRTTVVCGRCHEDTLARHARSPSPHKPVGAGECSACHDAHSSDGALLFRHASVIEQCATCHDWKKHSAHPLGPDVKDPRNRNLTMDCLSCHRAHGTEYKHLLPNPTETELCTKCHAQFKR